MSTSPEFSVPPGYSPPFAIISDSDHGGWIIIATSLGLIMALLATAIRVYVKWISRQHAGIDDFLLAAATVFAFVQESVILAACAQGLGRTVDLLGASSLRKVEKAFYSGQILSVLALGLCKCSVAHLILRLTPQTYIRRTLWTIIWCAIAWMIAAALAFALQCDLDNPWSFASGSCTGFFARVLVIGILDIVLEVALFLSAISLIFRLQAAWTKKAMVILAFGLRLPIIAFTAARIATGNVDISDFAITESLYIIWTETEINYSLISTTLPLLRPFIKDLATYYGTMTPSVYDESSSRSRANSYPLTMLKAKKGYNPKGSKGSSMPSGRTPSLQQEGLNILDFGGPPTLGLEAIPQCETRVQGGPARPSSEVNVSSNSLGSSGSNRMIIHVETEWHVER